MLGIVGRPGTTVSGPVEFVGNVARGAAAQVSLVVKPAAAAAVATSFGFPLALMLIVVLFLVVQPRLDFRDPKLLGGPAGASEAAVMFEDESRL